MLCPGLLNIGMSLLCEFSGTVKWDQRLVVSYIWKVLLSTKKGLTLAKNV